MSDDTERELLAALDRPLDPPHRRSGRPDLVPFLHRIMPGVADLEVHPTREAWLASRRRDIARGYLGSSSVAALLGLSGWASPWDVHAARWDTPGGVDLTDDIEPNEEDADPSGVLARGLVMEPRLWAAYRDRYAAEVIEPGHLRVKRGKLGVSPDAFVHDPGRGWGVGESKTVLSYQAQWVPRHDEEVTDILKMTSWPCARQYLAQCLALCAATRLPFCDLWIAVVVPVEDPRCAIATDEFPEVRPHAIERTIRIRVVPTAADLHAFMGQVGAFYARHLLEPGNPPPIDASDACWLAQLGPDPATRQRRRDATEDEAAQIQAYLEARDAERAATTDKKTARARLVGLMGDTKSVSVRDDRGGRITATISSNGRLGVRENRK